MAFKGRVNRKSRCDRNHVIYQVTNQKTGERYIGLTYVRPPTKKVSRSKMPMKSALDRFTSHCYRALEADSQTTFHQNIKEHGKDAFIVTILEVVRGKSVAHEKEVQLIQINQPELNM